MKYWVIADKIDIGADVLGLAGEADTTRIGRQGIQKAAFIAGIAGTPVSGVEVRVSGTGKLGIAASSARFKPAIKPMNRASEVILDLKPVTFRYKEEIDPAGILQFGLVAEQVDRVNPGLVDRDEQGRPYTVRYEAVNAMLLNEFIKEHRRVQELEAKVAQQKTDFEAAMLKQTAEMANVIAGLKEQESEVRSVKEQLALSGGRMQVVADER
jgi:Chaperone of endosialidase